MVWASRLLKRFSTEVAILDAQTLLLCLSHVPVPHTDAAMLHSLNAKPMHCHNDASPPTAAATSSSSHPRFLSFCPRFVPWWARVAAEPAPLQRCYLAITNSLVVQMFSGVAGGKHSSQPPPQFTRAGFRSLIVRLGTPRQQGTRFFEPDVRETLEHPGKGPCGLLAF